MHYQLSAGLTILVSEVRNSIWKASLANSLLLPLLVPQSPKWAKKPMYDKVEFLNAKQVEYPAYTFPRLGTCKRQGDQDVPMAPNCTNRRKGVFTNNFRENFAKR